MTKGLSLKKHLPKLLLGVAMILTLSFVWLRLSGGSVLSVQTGSMVPAINKGDLVVVTRVPEKQLKIGDVVTYHNPNNPKQTITHRIVALPIEQNEYKFITKGDANAAQDTPISYEKIIGREVASAPVLGRVIDLVRSPVGIALFIYIPSCLIIWSEIRRLRDHYKSQEPYYASNAIKRQLLQRRGQLS